MVSNLFSYIAIIFAAFSGFLIAFYIHRKKRANETLVYPLNSDCGAVIHSEYSKFLGIPVELLGTLYYGLIAASYVLVMVSSVSAPPVFTSGVLAITAAAFLFSLYLTFLQIFTIRQL